MKHSQKIKAKRAGAKQAASAATSTRRTPVKTKPRRKQSVSERRKTLDQIPVMPVSITEPKLSMPHLFWPVLPFTMMRMWWGTGETRKVI